MVSSGYHHSAFVDAGGQLLMCGKNMDIGLLGQGEGVSESAVPLAVAGLGAVRIYTVAAGCHAQGVHTLHRGTLHRGTC